MFDNDFGDSNVIYSIGGGAGQFPFNFPDPQLKACVEEVLGVTDPTPTDMLALRSRLYCGGRLEAGLPKRSSFGTGPDALAMSGRLR